MIATRPIAGQLHIVLVFAFALYLGRAQAQDDVPAREQHDALGFDEGMLSRRGIDPRLLEALSKAPALPPGEHRVLVLVNAQSRARHTIVFDADGKPCMTPELLVDIGIEPPHQPLRSDDAACVSLTDYYPTSQLEVDPGTLTLSLVVPKNAIKEQEGRLPDFSTGGAAALANYQYNRTDTRFHGDRSRFISLNTEVGFNAGEWKVRSRQVYSSLDGSSQTTHLDAYAQRAIGNYRAVLQVGQINLINPLLAGAQVTGIQVASESGLAAQASGVVVEGIAQSQARVEVRQQGVLIDATVVPEGPFRLPDVRRLNQHSDLEVTVIEADGSSHSFTVPAALQASPSSESGYVFGVGRIRNVAGSSREPWAASVGWDGGRGGLASWSYAALAAESYYALAVGMQNFVPFTQTQLRWQLAGSQAARDDAHGAQAQLTLTQYFADNWSFGASAIRQTEGYRELLDVSLSDFDVSSRLRLRDQYNATLGWSSTALGTLSARFSESTLFNGDRTRQGGASWGRRWRNVSVSLNADWNISGGPSSGANVYFNASMPLGRSHRASARVRSLDDSHLVGIGASGVLGDSLATYRVNVDRDTASGNADWSAGLSMVPRYTQVELNHARSANDFSSYSTSLRGALVLHGDGLTASPHLVGDSFAILKVGDQAGVRITTPSGPVWTDPWGRAIAAQLSPYQVNQLQVTTRTLPRNAEVQTGATELKVGRATVERVDFGLKNVRRVLLTVVDESGQLLKQGATVSSGDSLVAFVQDGGQVFLPTYSPGETLFVEGAERPRCKLIYELSAKPPSDAPFESLDAICRPVQEGGER